MPSVSKAQQQAMAIAEHEPSKLNAANKGLLKMSHKQLHDFAATPRKGLPSYKTTHEARKSGKNVSYADTYKARQK
jgi:hypothetical protein